MHYGIVLLAGWVFELQALVVFGSIFFSVLVRLRTQVVKEHLIPHTYLQWLHINENLETSPHHIKDSRKNQRPMTPQVTSAQLAARTAACQNLTLKFASCRTGLKI
jgi:hypothetical protein